MILRAVTRRRPWYHTLKRLQFTALEALEIDRRVARIIRGDRESVLPSVENLRDNELVEVVRSVRSELDRRRQLDMTKTGIVADVVV